MRTALATIFRPSELDRPEVPPNESPLGCSPEQASTAAYGAQPFHDIPGTAAEMRFNSFTDIADLRLRWVHGDILGGTGERIAARTANRVVGSGQPTLHFDGAK